MVKQRPGRQRYGSRRRTRQRQPYNIKDTQLSYNGPTVPQAMKNGLELVTIVMRLDTDVIASGGGVVSNVIGSNPASFSNWSQMSAAYDEYRVLSMTSHYEPYNKYNSSINQSPLYVVTDRADATALTSYAVALEYGSVLTTNSADRWSKTIKMQGAKDAQFTPVGTGVSALYIKLYASILTASIAIGRLSTSILVQFRASN